MFPEFRPGVDVLTESVLKTERRPVLPEGKQSGGSEIDADSPDGLRPDTAFCEQGGDDREKSFRVVSGMLQGKTPRQRLSGRETGIQNAVAVISGDRVNDPSVRRVRKDCPG